MSNRVIKIRNVSKTYRIGRNIDIQALKDINLDINAGDFVALVGSSGSGKSTLLNLIGCLDKPDASGQIFLNNEDVLTKSKKELSLLRNKNIGFIFQSFNLLPVLDVYENIEFPFLINKNLYTKQERKNTIDTLIEQVGLGNYRKHKSNELSGGQMQRVAIARALALSPLVVLADEPTANLDSVTSRNILELMRKLNEERNITFIFATHDPLVMEFTKRIISLKDGKIQD
ncbi:MAG: ABC transporter ATP-binding protein [Dysgonomonas sp.]